MLDLAVTIPAYKSSVYLLDEPVFKIAQINKKDLLFGNAIREFTEFIFSRFTINLGSFVS